MARVGDGTGVDDPSPTKQGLSSNEGKEPEGQVESGGSGSKLVPKGNRNSPR